MNDALMNQVLKPEGSRWDFLKTFYISELFLEQFLHTYVRDLTS